MRYHIKLAAMAALLCMLTGIYACSKDNNNDTAPSVTPLPNNVRVAASAKFGAVITDSSGRSLYFFAIDANGTSGCTGGCLTTWPVFYTEKLTLDSTLKAADFAAITRADGKKQTTYKGWPLYYYQNDTKAGDFNGEAIGNKWFVAKPDYVVMLANIQLVGNNNIQYNSQFQPGQEVSQYLTDDYGRTLYGFSPDKFNINTYTKQDFSNNGTWPIYEKSISNVPSILDKTIFATTNVWGKTQLTYKGWPLYYFGPDAQTRGNTKGVSVPKPGVWPIVNLTTATAPQP